MRKILTQRNERFSFVTLFDTIQQVDCNEKACIIGACDNDNKNNIVGPVAAATAADDDDNHDKALLHTQHKL